MVWEIGRVDSDRDSVDLVERALKAIREAKRPTFWQVTKEATKMLIPDVMVVLGGFGFLLIDIPLLAVLAWVSAGLLFLLQVWALWTSVRIRRDLFETRDKIAAINGKITEIDRRIAEINKG